MGWRRSSNLDERPSFHLRKTVQRIATAPTDAATAIRTVSAMLLGFATLDWACGGTVDVSEASTDSVRVTTGFGTGAVGSGTPVTLSASEVAADVVLDCVVDVVCEAWLVVVDSVVELVEPLAEVDSETNDDADVSEVGEEDDCDADVETLLDALPDEVAGKVGTAAPAPATGPTVRIVSP
jgi:hypothetical protein